MRGLLAQRSDGERDLQQLKEAKTTLEGELGEIRSQLERDGYTSVAQMRCVFVSQVHQEKCLE